MMKSGMIAALSDAASLAHNHPTWCVSEAKPICFASLSASVPCVGGNNGTAFGCVPVYSEHLCK